MGTSYRLPTLAMAIGAGFLLTQPAKSQQLWNGTSVGMTESDVLKLYPRAHPPLKPEKPTIYADVTLLQSEDIRLGGHVATVDFMFKNNVLDEIGIHIAGPNDQTAISGVEAKQLLDEMKEKYGNPIRYRSVWGTGTACFWIKGKIFIGYMGVLNDPGRIYIIYRTSLPSDRNL